MIGGMQHRVVRASILDVAPRRPLGFAAEIVGRALDIADDVVPLRTADVSASIDDDMTVTRFATSAGDLSRPGHSAGRGFRAALDFLRSAGASGRLLHRLLWDVPILAQVAGQTALLDH